MFDGEKSINQKPHHIFGRHIWAKRAVGRMAELKGEKKGDGPVQGSQKLGGIRHHHHSIQFSFHFIPSPFPIFQSNQSVFT